MHFLIKKFLVDFKTVSFGLYVSTYTSENDVFERYINS